MMLVTVFGNKLNKRRFFFILGWGKHTVQTSYNLNGTCVCFRVKMQNACACVSPHVATRVSFCSNIIITNLQPLPSSTCFHILSVANLSIPNDAENIRIIISVMRQESNA